MLKLERTSREGKINLIVRDKEPLFTRPFTMALAIAVAIHLGLVILFHVAPFTIGSNEKVFAPTSVEADAASTESVVAEILTSNHTIRGLPKIPSIGPALPPQPKFLSFRPLEYLKAESSTDQAFNQIEQKIYQPEFHPLIHSVQKPLEIVISGILSGYELLSDGLDGKSMPKISGNLAYSVKIEGRTGKVFWFEPENVVSNNFVENVLRRMKFAVDPKAIAISGKIEFLFHPEAE